LVLVVELLPIAGNVAVGLALFFSVELVLRLMSSVASLSAVVVMRLPDICGKGKGVTRTSALGGGTGVCATVGAVVMGAGRKSLAGGRLKAFCCDFSTVDLVSIETAFSPGFVGLAAFSCDRFAWLLLTFAVRAGCTVFSMPDPGGLIISSSRPRFGEALEARFART
jgi:hypothetical protein